MVGENEVLVTRIELDYGVSAGIKLRSLGEGVVPLQEEHEARLERGIGLDAWMSMDVREKALIIAVRRVRGAIHNINTEVQIKHAQRTMRRSGR